MTINEIFAYKELIGLLLVFLIIELMNYLIKSNMKKKVLLIALGLLSGLFMAIVIFMIAFAFNFFFAR